MALRIVDFRSSKPLLYGSSNLLPKAGFPTGAGSAVVEIHLPDLLQEILDGADFLNPASKTPRTFSA